MDSQLIYPVNDVWQCLPLTESLDPGGVPGPGQGTVIWDMSRPTFPQLHPYLIYRHDEGAATEYPPGFIETGQYRINAAMA